MKLEDILAQLNTNLNQLDIVVNSVDNSTFFDTIDKKWSVAEQLEHLSISFFATNLAFTLPKKLVSTLYGKNNRTNMSYDEVIEKYVTKLNQGSKASFPYQPKISMLKNKKLILKFWQSTQKKLLNNVALLNEEDLDVYIIPHPIIGKITWREFLFFTIYHISHHTKSIKELIALILKK